MCRALEFEADPDDLRKPSGSCRRRVRVERQVAAFHARDQVAEAIVSVIDRVERHRDRQLCRIVPVADVFEVGFEFSGVVDLASE
uniref:Uncharacterized protein n=1 Tax=uncultured marine virus TaxID=186617 RepID=A0A0F7L9T5_9VIRU|nr:hypothetical protein [uncultured marine virus]